MANRRLPPNLYARQYRTQRGYKQTRYYVRFTDWQGKRRLFAAGADFAHAKAERDRLKTLDAQQHDFDAVAAVATPSTLADWLDRFLKIKAAKKTAAKDKLSVQRLKQFFGDCTLAAVVPSRMLEYRGQRALTAAVATINREMACLRTALRLAYQDGALARLPAVPMEREHNERIRTASDAEYQQILKALPTNIRPVIELLWETGFRVGEVLALQAAHLDFTDQAVDVTEIREKGGLKRTLPMSPRAWQILTGLSQLTPQGPLFAGITRHQVHWHFVAACKQHAIKGLWVHDIRASFCTRKEREGWPRKVICEFSGHRTENAFKRYSRPTTDDLKRFIGNTMTTSLSTKTQERT